MRRSQLSQHYRWARGCPWRWGVSLWGEEGRKEGIGYPLRMFAADATTRPRSRKAAAVHPSRFLFSRPGLLSTLIGRTAPPMAPVCSP